MYLHLPLNTRQSQIRIPMCYVFPSFSSGGVQICVLVFYSEYKPWKSTPRDTPYSLSFFLLKEQNMRRDRFQSLDTNWKFDLYQSTWIFLHNQSGFSKSHVNLRKSRKIIQMQLSKFLSKEWGKKKWLCTASILMRLTYILIKS